MNCGLDVGSNNGLGLYNSIQIGLVMELGLNNYIYMDMKSELDIGLGFDNSNHMGLDVKLAGLGMDMELDLNHNNHLGLDVLQDETLDQILGLDETLDQILGLNETLDQVQILGLDENLDQILGLDM